MPAALLLAMTPLTTTPAAAEEDRATEDFSYERWDGHYDLSLDSEDRAVAEVREEIVAQFPETDQNRGIVRALPLEYEGASAAPEDITVTDASGEPVPFDVEDEDGFRLILTGDDAYVHGEQEYHLEYTLHDVIHSPDDADIDEFFWDLIPSDRAQDISSASAELVFSPDLADALTGESACYAGTPENSDDCGIGAASQNQDGSAELSVDSLELPGESGLSVAVGLEADTVTQPEVRQPNALLDIGPVVVATLAVAAGLLGGFLIFTQSQRRSRDMGTTAPEYGVPDGLSPLLAAPLGGAWRPALPAEFVHLAVMGALVIEDDGQNTPQGNDSQGEKPRKKRSKNAGQPTFRLVDPTAAPDPLDQQILEILFPGLQPGTTFTLPKQDATLRKKLESVVQEGPKAAVKRGYSEKVRHGQAALCGGIALLLLIPLAALLAMGWDRPNIATTTTGITGGVIAAGLGITAVLKHRVYLPPGARIRHQLDQLRSIMKSPEGQRAEALVRHDHAGSPPDASAAADRVPPAQLVPVFDRATPYAILFGSEKKWFSVLDVTYRAAGVDVVFWYPALMRSGSSSVGGSLSSMVSSMSSATSSSSSSGAGSGGGGSVGGGGGGGFAGGR